MWYIEINKFATLTTQNIHNGVLVIAKLRFTNLSV